MSSVPEEIYHEILLRLPVKSLLRCKSVCKNWYALISTSSHFVKQHHNRIIQENNPILMLQGYEPNQFYSIDYNLLASSSECEIDNDVIEMDYPFKSCNYGISLLGSYDGLVWMWLFENDGDKDLFCIWNPATREFKEIPKSPLSYEFNRCTMRAFGYDQKTGDYKLVIGVKVKGNERSTFVQVYTLASNSWKDVQTVPYQFRYMENCGALVNGDFHWLGISQDDPLPKNNCSVISLDISDESFKELQLPKEISGESRANPNMILGVLEECLCIFVCRDVNGVGAQFDLWEMLDYGVRESWTKRCVITTGSFMSLPFYFRIVRSFKNGKILFWSSGKLVLYDTKDASAKQKIYSISLSNALNYFESVVSLNSGTYLGAENH